MSVVDGLSYIILTIVDMVLERKADERERGEGDEGESEQ